MDSSISVSSTIGRQSLKPNISRLNVSGAGLNRFSSEIFMQYSSRYINTQVPVGMSCWGVFGGSNNKNQLQEQVSCTKSKNPHSRQCWEYEQVSANLFPPGLVPNHSNTISVGRAVELEIDLFPTGAQPISNIACTVCSQQGELVNSYPAPATHLC